MMIAKRAWKMASVGLILALISACSNDAASLRKKYLESGNKYFGNGKYKEASIMYRRALQKDMRFGEGYYRLGLSELKLGRPVDAMRALQRAVELDPKNLDAPARLAEIYLTFYAVNPAKPKEFIKEIEDLAKKLTDNNPNSYDGLRLNGYIALTKQDAKGALAAFEKANAVKPNQPELVLVLVQTLGANDRWDEAEKLARDLIAKNKSYNPIYNVLYTRLSQQKRLDEAEALLKLQVANEPKNVSHYLQLAAHYFVINRRDEMQNTLNQIINDPKTFPNRHLAVGEFFFRIKDLDNAIRQFELGAKDQPKDKHGYQKKIVETMVLQGKKTEATQLVETILKEDASDTEALAMRASLKLQAGTREEVQSAINDLQSVVAKSPENHVLRFNLARALIAKGDLDAARVQLLEAIKYRPDYQLAKLALAQVYISKQDYQNAVQSANQVLQFDPTNLAARLLKTSALIGMREFGQARTDLEGLLKQSPALPDAQFQLGMLNLAEKSYPQAESIFKSFYANSPTDPRSLAGLIEVLTSQQQFDQAMNLLKTEIGKAPDRNDLRVVYANTAARANKLDIAESEFRQLLAKSPKSADLHLRLGDVLRLRGDLKGAMDAFAKAKEIMPNDVNAYVRQAMILESQGNLKDARPIYEKIMTIDPDNPVALNNVAYLMAEEGSNLDQALSFANRAKQRMPNHPDVNDTLGWIYIKKNLSDNAVNIFRDLTGRFPEKSTYHYHLGMALFQKGDKPNARKSLELALTKNPDAAEQGKIRELMAKL
ncbi:MAG: tetratricopeptide repeat protein [Bryobacteraceae bacterium]|nr:tetratricopeptide repeat protein [Bryobacteraceae bacterium]